jgi:hypothetical protein
MRRSILKYTLLIVPLFYLLFVVDSHSQDTRNLGMAGTSMVLARSTDAPLWNPANLALPREKNWSFTIFNIEATLSNSSFPKRYYDLYNGAFLDEDAKNDILGRITKSGLGVIANARVQLLSIAFSNYAITITGTGACRASAPRDLVDLILFGNQLDRTYKATGTDAHALSTASFGFSAAKAVSFPWLKLKASSIGATIKYHYGIGCAELLDAELSATTTATEIAANGLADFRFGTPGGQGFSIDIGAAADINDRWSVGLSWSDLISTIHFSGDSYRGMYRFTVDSLSAFSFEDTDIDSIFNTEEKEEEHISFSTVIPSELKLGGGYFAQKVTVTAVYVQGFRKTGFSSSTPGFAVGVEYKPWKLLNLRTGMGIGGVHGFRLAWGFSFNPGPITMDFAFQNVGGLTSGQSRGISGGFGIRCNW